MAGYSIGIIGGGASGLFAACMLKRNNGKDIDITILEKKSEPGIKLTLTGHGRCNITNRKNISDLKAGYHEAGNFLYPALKAFGPVDTMRFVEEKLGLRLKEEDNNRILPVCDSAIRVRDEVLKYIEGSAKILTDTKVLKIEAKDCFEVSTDKGNFVFDKLILACGGSSFPKTGSTGDSYKFAGSLGHKIEPVRAALSPVRACGQCLKICKDLTGVSLTSGVSVWQGGKKTHSAEGEILFADFGLTGPAVMKISREVTEGSLIELDLIPRMTDEEFDRELQALISEHPDTKIATLLARYIPSSVATKITEISDAKDRYAQSFTKEMRKKVCKEAKHLRIETAGAPDIEKAYVTRGGVSLKEVDRKTMQSKLVPNLYILGEALDIDGLSGGYNLQACMSEANLAAISIMTRK